MPLSDGRTDLLRNKIPVCDECRDQWLDISPGHTPRARQKSSSRFFRWDL
ncbi:hypothetical protein OG241_13655 [Streptomyces sp. NBC_01390]